MSKVDTLVVGSVAVDSISKLDAGHRVGDSNPGSTQTSIGGVGHNVALASQYSGGSTRLVSVIGDDQKGQMILSTMKMDTTGLLVKDTENTASYTSIHSSDGELIIACGDMKIVEQDFSDHIINQIKEADAKVVILDCNLTPKTMNKVLDSINPESKVIVEPTSLIKARRIAELQYPIDLITPTINELNAIYETMETNERFDDDWFEYIDHLKLDQFQRFNLKPIYQQLYNEGVIQKAFRLLPFTHNILIKLGKNGILSIGSKKNDIFLAAKKKSPYYLQADHFYIEYFPIPKQNENLKIVNVTGAGDSMLGYLLANVHKKPKNELLYNAQLASGKSLSHSDAISPQISHLV